MRLPPAELDDAIEPRAAEDVADVARDDVQRLGSDPLERRQVEVVVVRVGDEDGVDLADLVPPEGGAPAQVGDTPPQERVGQEARPVERDEHGRVPDVRHARHPSTLTCATRRAALDGSLCGPRPHWLVDMERQIHGCRV